jgi:hypothetical protein
MVPGHVQGGTRVVPVKCPAKAGPGVCLGHFKCLCCHGGRSGGRASARALFLITGQSYLGSRGRSPSRKSGVQRHPKPPQSHFNATSKPL